METSHLDNRYVYSTFVQYLLLSQQYDRAEELLTQTSLYPEDSLLHWVHLNCLQRQPDRAVERLVPLLKSEPENPYFRLAALETFHHTDPLSTHELRLRYSRIYALANNAARPDDILAKLGCSASVKGLWSLGLSYFVDSMNSIISRTQEQVLLLSPRNRTLVEKFLKEELIAIDGLVIDDSLNSALTLDILPDQLLSPLFCILLTANEMEIPEASFLIARIASRHPELSQYDRSPRSMVAFAIRHAPGWIGIQLPYSKQPIIHWN